MLPGSLTPGDVQRINNELTQFLISGAGALDSIGFEGPVLSQSTIENLRNKLLYGLQFVAGFSPKVKGFAGWEVSDARALEGIQRVVRKGAMGLRGPRDAMILLLASELIASPAGEKIAACAAPDCTNVFYKQRRNLYCSRACAQRTRTQRYKTNPERKGKNAKAKAGK
jgi:hypothetical protein